jgi:hypothetical protein
VSAALWSKKNAVEKTSPQPGRQDASFSQQAVGTAFLEAVPPSELVCAQAGPVRRRAGTPIFQSIAQYWAIEVAEERSFLII